jgi:hypothetical protein
MGVKLFQFLLILLITQVEYDLKEMYTELLSDREVMWHEKKRCVSECINDFSQNHSASSVHDYLYWGISVSNLAKCQMSCLACKTRNLDP